MSTTSVDSPSPARNVADLRRNIPCTPPESGLHEDWVPIPIVMADVARWLRVDSIPDGASEGPANHEPLAVLAASERGGVAQRELLSVSASAVPMLEQALAVPGVEVYFGAGSASGQLADDVVWVLLAVDDAAFTIIGACDAVRSNAELEAAYGDDAFQIVKSAIWLEGDELRKVLRQEESPPPSTMAVQIVPGMTHDENELSAYETHTVMVEWPADVRSDSYTICVRSGVTWGGCVLLGAIDRDFGPYSLAFASSKDEPESVEVWILGAAAKPSEPRQLVATLPPDSFANGAVPIVSVGTLILPESGAGTAADVRIGDVTVDK